MTNTQLWVNQGKDGLGNGVSGVLPGKTISYGLSSKAFSSFTAVDTYATRTEVTYWTGGAALTQVLPAFVNGASLGSQITFATTTHTDGPNNITCGLVMIPASSLLLYVVDLVSLVNANLGTTYTVLDMSLINQQILWTPEMLLQNVGGG
jgi:hypothetical protein